MNLSKIKQIIGIFLIAIGIVGLVYFMQMDTAVYIDTPGADGMYKKIHNIGLMNEKSNMINVSGIVFLAGIILVSFPTIKKQENKS